MTIPAVLHQIALQATTARATQVLRPVPEVLPAAEALQARAAAVHQEAVRLVQAVIVHQEAHRVQAAARQEVRQAHQARAAAWAAVPEMI